MDNKRLIASARALNRVINNGKAGENPSAIIAKISRGEAIGDDEFGILVELERGVIALLDTFEKQELGDIE